MRPLDAALADLGAVDIEHSVAAFAEAAAVVGELDPHLALSCGQRLGTVGL